MPELPDMSSKQPQQQNVNSDVRDNEINQLSDMVKNLLSEQQSLKSRLAEQEQQINTFQKPRSKEESEPSTQSNSTTTRNVQRSKPKFSAPQRKAASTSA